MTGSIVNFEDFCVKKRFFHSLTFWYYSGFGTKLRFIFRLSLNIQVQNHFPIKPITQIRCSSCYAGLRHDCYAPKFIRSNFPAQCRQLFQVSISVAFPFSVCRQNYVFPLKTQNKNEKFSAFCFPPSVFRKVIHICFSFAFQCQISSFICVGSLASSLLSFLLNLLVDVSCFFSTEQYGITSWHYSGFGTKLSPIFGLAKSSQVQDHFSIKPNAQIRCSGCYKAVLLSVSCFHRY